MNGQATHVLAPHAQRRDMDVHGAQAKQQIVAEIAGRHHGLQILVGGRHQPKIAGLLLLGPDRSEAALLEHPQKGLLLGKGQFPHFVEKQGALVRLFDQAFLLFFRAGEGPFGVAEQHGFDERFGQTGTIDNDEGALGPIAVVMDGPGEKFLAGAGFPGDQRISVGIGGLGHEVETAHHAVAVADDALALEGHGRRTMGEFFLAVLEGADQGQGHGLGRSRFFDIIPGPVLDGQLGAVGIARAGENNDFRGLVTLGDPGDGQQAVAVRQVHIQVHHVERTPIQGLHPFGQAGAGRDLVAHPLNDQLADLANMGVVIDDQNVRH